MPKAADNTGRRFRTTVRVAAFFVLAAVMVGGVSLYWRFVYLPAEILTAFRNGKVSGIQAGIDEVPKFVREYFEQALPALLNGLYGEDENLAALAFVALRYRLKGKIFETFREERFPRNDPDDRKFRAALLIEWELSPGSTKDLDFPTDFRSRYLRWKAKVRPGPFTLQLDYRIDACRELAKIEGKEAVPFLLQRIRDPNLPQSQKLPVAVLLARRPEIVEVYAILTEDSISPVFFLTALLRNKSLEAREVMERAFRSGDPGQESVALGYFLRYPDRDGASLVESLLASPDTEIDLRVRIVASFLRLETPWVAKWGWRNLALWSKEEIGRLLADLTGELRKIPRSTLRNLITWAAADPREGVPAEALNAWVSMEGKKAYFPFGHLDWVPGEDPLQALESPAGGLARKKIHFRLNWSKRVIYAVTALEAAGVVDAMAGDRLVKAVATAVMYLQNPPAPDRRETDLRARLTRFAGIALARHGSILPDRESVSRSLEQLARNEREWMQVRIEAAFWLGLSGEGRQGVREALLEGMKGDHIGRRFACAAALAGLFDKETGRGPEEPVHREDPRKVFLDAWEGSNPLLSFLAAREIPLLPTPLLARAVPSMLKISRVRTHELRDLARAGREGLSFIMCMDHAKAAGKAEWLVQGKIPGGLTTVWADRAGAPADPEGDPSVLLDLAAVMGDVKNEPGRVRAACLLLRHWTGRAFGFYPLHWEKPHAVAVGNRWKAWLEANMESLKWDEETNRFRIR